jgi:hypothetical protein
MHDLLLPQSCRMPSPPDPPRLDNSNFTWWRVQVMQLIIIKFSRPSCHFIPLWPKFFPQHPALKPLDSLFLLQCQRPSFTPIQNHWQYCSLIYSNVYISREQTRRLGTEEEILCFYAWNTRDLSFYWFRVAWNYQSLLEASDKIMLSLLLFILILLESCEMQHTSKHCGF